MRNYFNKILIFGILFIWPLGNLQAALLPNDEYYRQQWYLDKIRAAQAWGKVTSAEDIIVAVIDSGIQIDHPDLKDNIWKSNVEIPNNKIDDDHNGFIDDVNGWNFLNNTPNPAPEFSADYTEGGISHGTMISGIIGAMGNNGVGVTGVAWRVKIMALRALDDKGEGKMSDVVRAVDYATKNGADIINLSFVSPSYSEGLKDALERAYNAGVIVVAASGNDRVNNINGQNLNKIPVYPACYEGDKGENLVIGVAATDAIDQKTPFSGYGSRCVDISAPGISFFNTVTYKSDFANGAFSKYYDGYWSGTSMATPLVSGAFALVKQVNPNLTRDQIINIILKGTDVIDDNNPQYLGELGTGRLNLETSVNWAWEKLTDYTGRILLSPYATGPYYNFSKTETHINKIRLTESDGQTFSEFETDKNKIKSGLNLASGDLNGDSQPEIVTAGGLGDSPLIKIFDLKGKVKKEFLAYDKNFKGGVSLAVGDIDNDGKKEIITAPSSKGYPQIKVFDINGKMKISFLAYDRKFTNGVNVASGDVNADGLDEIITSPGIGGGPHVRIFDRQGNLKGQFMAYESSFRGGVKVAAGNVDGRFDRSKVEIIVAPQSGREPLVRVFDNWGKAKSQFMAYEKKFKNGVSLAAGDLNRDGRAEIITSAAPGGAPHVRVFKYKGELLESFYAYKDTFNYGVNVGFILLNN